jgi:uncharacterized protein YukE
MSMTQAVEVDPDQLRKAATLMAQIGDALGSAATMLTNVLTAAGEPWSGDEYGKEFYDGSGESTGYSTSSKTALTDFANLVSAVQEYSANMRGAADDLEYTDRTSFQVTAA